MKKSAYLTSVFVLVFFVILAWYGLDFFGNKPPETKLSPTSQDQKEFVDKERGLFFQYPDIFQVKTYTDFQGEYVIELVPQNSSKSLHPMQRAVDSLFFTFSSGTLDRALKEYQEDASIKDLTVHNIAIEDLNGKKVSFHGGVGIYSVMVIFPWRDNMLLKIGYFPDYPEHQDTIYQEIIASVQRIK